MAFPWLKLWSEARKDRKLHTLSYQERWVWFCLLCLSGEGDVRGTISACTEISLAAEVAEGDVELLRSVIDKLQKLGMLDVLVDGGLRFVHWQKRQGVAPSDAPQSRAARVRKYRASNNNRLHDDADVTGVGSLHPPPIPVTSSAPPPPDPVTPSAVTRLDIDQDQDGDLELNTAYLASERSNDPAVRPRAHRAGPIPDTLALNDDDLSWWKGLLANVTPPPPADWSSKTWLATKRDMFLEFYRGRQPPKLSSDWYAEWRVWMRREIQFYLRTLHEKPVAGPGSGPKRPRGRPAKDAVSPLDRADYLTPGGKWSHLFLRHPPAEDDPTPDFSEEEEEDDIADPA